MRPIALVDNGESGLGGDGTSDDNPILLPQVESVRFEALIEFFHPRYRYERFMY